MRYGKVLVFKRQDVLNNSRFSVLQVCFNPLNAHQMVTYLNLFAYKFTVHGGYNVESVFRNVLMQFKGRFRGFGL